MPGPATNKTENVEPVPPSTMTMSTRSLSPPATSNRKGNKCKASSPLAKAETPIERRVIDAFVGVNKVLATLKNVINKMSPKKKGLEPSIRTLVLLLENKLLDYGKSLNEAFTSVQEEAAAAAAMKSSRPSTVDAATGTDEPPRPTMRDSSTDMELTSSWGRVDDGQSSGRPFGSGVSGLTTVRETCGPDPCGPDRGFIGHQSSRPVVLCRGDPVQPRR